ncbi:MAG TPA: ABC transporter ATP-binding protein [Streptosporangiaceae bacterium]|jgi:oligopeptide/dipeptide ABC transporter ATP-binding protein|nr:ABC transporter ATP-binding protein [Streptosporangiaceae bacterium]
MPGVLEVTDLHVSIRQRRSVVRAVDGVSFTVGHSEIVGLVGESGCGKTMSGLATMRLLPNGGRIDSGSIQVGETDVLSLSERQMRAVRGNQIAMIFQDPMTSLNPTMTIGDQIAEAVLIHRDSAKAAAAKRAAEVLDLVGMPRAAERLGQYPHQLSGGLRQRAMIAMALACEPRVLIADEPTTALDVTIQAQILTLLQQLKTDLGMGILLVTHDMGVIAAHADRVLVMYAGRIVEEAETVALFDESRHPYTKALLRSIPQPDRPARGLLYSIPGAPPNLALELTGCRFRPRCANALDECAVIDPPLQEQDAGRHLFACLNPEPVGAERLAPRDVATAGGSSASGPDGEPILRLENVVKEFRVTRGVFSRKARTAHAVSGVSFEIYAGETFGLVGESGCGKSTVSRLIVGLERPTSGSITFNGKDVAVLAATGPFTRRRRSSDLRRNLQMMFQDPYSSLDPRMRVGGIVREPLVIQSIGTARERTGKVAAQLLEVGLPGRAVDLYPHEFSGGQRQRIGLARALILEPRLLIADEPVSALDVSIRAQILNLMQTLQASYGLTYLLISHDLGVIRQMANRIGVMYLGKMVEIGPAESVYTAPAHPYTAGLIDTAAIADPRRERARTRTPVTGELPSAFDPPSGCRFRTRCALAQDVCATEEPAMRSFGDGHSAACHFPLRQPASAQGSGQ